MAVNYYEVLGIPKNATPDEIKRAYRKAALKYHPDRNKEPGAEDRFKEAAEAYDVLKDPVRREQYDMFGTASKRRASRPSQVNIWDDVFTRFDFGDTDAGDRFYYSWRGAGNADITQDIEVTLEEVLSGCQKELTYERLIMCDQCKGVGGTGYTCPDCGGYGHVAMNNVFGHRRTRRCGNCNGKGTIVQSKCPHCQMGSGTKYERRTVRITVPQGVSNDQILLVRLGGHAHLEDLKQHGDLRVRVRVKRHKMFHRRGQDLLYMHKLSFTDACLGANIEIPTLGGNAVIMEVPPGTQFGQMFRVAGKGLPGGHLFVEMKVTVPKNLAPGADELLRQFKTLQENADENVSNDQT